MLDDHHNNNSHHSNHHVYVSTINLFQQLFTTSPRETPRSSAVSTKVVALEVAWNSKRSPGMRLFRCVWCFFLWKKSGYVQNEKYEWKKIGFGNPYSRHTRCLSVSTTRFSNFKNNMCFISGSIVSLKDKYVSKRIQKKSWPWWLTNLWLRFFVYQCQ